MSSEEPAGRLRPSLTAGEERQPIHALGLGLLMIGLGLLGIRLSTGRPATRS